MTSLVHGIRALMLAYNIVNRRESRQVESITREFRLNRVSRDEFFITLLNQVGSPSSLGFLRKPATSSLG
jgi:hypothetical protein